MTSHQLTSYVKSSKKRITLHPFLGDILVTACTQGAVLVSLLATVSMVAHAMGPISLGKYLLLRRLTAWIVAGSMLGLELSLTREIAHCVTDTEATARRYLLSASVFYILLTAGLILVSQLADQRISHLLFGESDRGMLWALGAMVSGLGISNLVYGYFRGRQKMRIANVIQLFTVGVFPVAAVLATKSRGSAALTIGATGAAICVFALLWIVSASFRVRGLSISVWAKSIIHLLGYGVRRVPGDFAAAGLFALAPFVAVHYLPADQVGYLLLGTTCLNAASLAVTPVSVVLLAKASQLFGQGRDKEICYYIQQMRAAVWQVSLYIMVQGVAFAKPAMHWWVGQLSEKALTVMCITMAALPAYMYFVMMRSTIDAKSRAAHNAKNVVASLVLFAVLSGAIVMAVPRHSMIDALSIATVIVIYVLAVLTDFRLHKMGFGRMQLTLEPLPVVVLTGLLSFAAEVLFHFEIGKLEFVGVSLLNIGIAAWLLKRRQPEWLRCLLHVGLFGRTHRPLNEVG